MFERSLRFRFLVLLCLGTFALVVSTPVLADVEGRVFRDYDADGVADGSEPGVAGLTVHLYDTTNASVGSVSTAADGTYVVPSALPAGTDLRLEIDALPGFLRPGPFGSDSGTTVVFVQNGQTGVDIGLANPGQHCQTPTALGELDLATNCYIAGTQNGSTEDVLVSFDYLAGDTGPSGDVDLPAPAHLASAQELGPTWGLAYQSASNSIFAGAFMKRHVSFLSDGATGVIFQVDLDGPTISTFLDLDTLFGAGTAGGDPHPAGTDLVRDNNNDGADGDINEAWDAVGKRSLGDLDLSDDQSTLYLVNLFDRSLYSIPLGSDPSNPVAPGAAGDVTVTAIPDPCPNSADARPFGLGVRDGVVYVGGVCSAETSQDTNDLSAYVYTYTDGGGFGGAPVLAFDIDHGRGCAVVPGCASADWLPWNPDFSFMNTNFGREIIYPQPMLTDIDFDGDDLILGFRDRFGDQTGFDQRSTDPSDNTLYRGDSAGSMVRACLVGGALTLESNGSCGGVAGAGVGNGRGPGGGQFYPVAFPDHDHVALAGLASVPGFADLSFTMYDPIFDSNEFFDGGAGWNRQSDGGTERRFRIYSSNDTDPNTFAKGGGLGDQEALCEPPPLEIGNRVWDDPDLDGIQDPGEAGIPGVTLRLFCGGSEVGSTTTDANGQYLFNASNVAGGIPTQTSCEVRIDAADPALGGRAPVVANAGTNDLHDSDGILAGGTVAAALTTGRAGENDHTYDFGFAAAPIFGTIGDTVWCDGLEGTGNGVFEAGEGVANVTVNLFDDTNCDDVADGGAVSSQSTVGDGQYLFTGLAVGTPGSPVCYVVRVDSADPDLGTCDSPITPVETSPDLDSDNPDDLDNDFGFEEPLGTGTIGDTVWCDGLEGTGNGVFDAGEGVAGVTVNLFEDTNCDDVADGGAVSSQSTTGDGQYLFTGLAIGPPGSPVCYVVRVDGADPDLGTCDSPITPTETSPDLDNDEPDDLDNDFGFEEPLGTGTIGDTVWCDGLEGTGNGVFDAGEGVTGVTVNLFEDTNCDDVADGGAVSSQSTTGDGQYLFTGLAIGPPGSPVCYVVRVDGADPDLGTCDSPITLVETSPDLDNDGPDDLDNDFGFEEPLGTGTIGDTVWCDGLEGTGNGVFDAGEGVTNVTVNLFEDTNCDDVADGGAVSSQSTTGDGQYLFTGLAIGPPGSPVCYVVRVDGTDPDLGTCDSPITPVETSPDLDSDNPDDLDNDFGFEEPLGTGTIGDTVWCDGLEGTGNGVFDAGEGVAGVTVDLFEDTNCDDVADGGAVSSQSTVGDGQYLFTGLAIGPPGSPVCYVVRVDGTDPDLGTCDSPITPVETSPDLDNDEPDDLDNDFGFEEPLGTGTIGDTVWCDGLEGTGNGIFDAGEGVAGVTVDLFEDTNCDDVADGGAVSSQSTTGDGQYLFTGLAIGPPGSPVCYVVRVDGTDPDLGTCDSPITPVETSPDLDNDEPDDLDNDFGFEEPLGTGTIGDTVWCDGLEGTGNGVFDAGEGVAGVSVDLFEDTNCDDIADGGAVSSQSTTGDGQYLFTGLAIGPPGSPVCYVVRVDGTDPDLGVCTLPITPVETPPDLDNDDPNDLDNDFGFVEPCQDSDGDGVCNESCMEDRDGDGEPDCTDFDPQGYLYCEDTGEILPGGQIDVSGPGAVTILEDGSSGRYLFFTDNTPGVYTLSVTPPASYPLSDRCLDQGVLDPTGMEDPLALGAGENLDSGILTSYFCDENPFFLTFDLEAGDPIILNNNIPLQYCSQPVPEIPTISDYGMAILVLLLAMAGGRVLRRRV